MDASQHLPERTELGGFFLLEKIAVGGMGTVYRARQKSLDREVALKVLPQSLADDPLYRDSFRREATAAARLQHPNIIPIFDAGEAEGLCYYAMEFVRGETLRQWVQRDGRLPEKTVLEIGVCVARGLKHAWDKEQLIHRDVKPENVMIDAEGNVKLCDLGLAKTFGENTLLTLSGDIFGTPQFMSPEQARADATVDFRADMYSLALTLYYALTAQIPFHAETPTLVMARRFTEPLADPRAFAPDVSPGLCRVLEKMLAKNAPDRYRAWDDVIAEFELVLRREAPTCALLPPEKSTLRRDPISAQRAAASRTDATAVAGNLFSSSSSRNAKPPAASTQKHTALITTVAIVIAAGVAGLIFLKPPQPPTETAPPSPLTPQKVVVAPLIPPPPEKPPEAVDTQEAERLLQDAKDFAGKNPQHFDEILARLEKVARRFPLTLEGIEAQEQFTKWAERKRTSSSHKAVEAAWQAVQQYAQANPNDLDGAMNRAREFLEKHKDSPFAADAQARLAEWNGQKLAAEQRQREEALKRDMEKRAGDVAARLAAESKFAAFGALFMDALGKRNYSAAMKLADAAAADPSLAALSDRVANGLHMAQRLESFWSGLPRRWEKLRGKTVELGGKRGKLNEVSKGQTAIEIKEGVEVGISLNAVSFENIFDLTASCLEPDDTEGWGDLGWFCVAEGKEEKAMECFGRRRKTGADVAGDMETANYFLKELPQSRAALDGIAAFRALLEKNQWTAARAQLESLRARFGKTAVMKSSSVELLEMEQQIVAMERQNTEQAAQRLIAEARAAVAAKQWRMATEKIELLKSQFASTNAVAVAAAELEQLSQTAFLATSGHGLIAHWKMDETRGNIVRDSSPSRLDGTLEEYEETRNGWQRGRLDNALFLNGRGNHVNIPGSERTLNPGKRDWTATAWVKTTVGGTQVILGKMQQRGQDLVLQVGTGQRQGVARFSLSGQNINIGISGKTNITDGEWHHIAGTRTADKLRLYVDGVLEAELTDPRIAETIESDAAVQLGRYGLWDGWAATRFNGMIDDVRLYSRALTAQEINALSRQK